MKRTHLLFIVIALVLFIDQASKIWVKTHMAIGEEFSIFGLSWALIHFVENEGMAFGWKIPAVYGKLILSVFRLGALVFLIYLIRQLLQAKASTGILISFGLIFAGALGNIIDSVFYGLIFSDSPYHGGVAEMFPEGGGYAGILYGKVVDMLYFPLFQTTWPEWMPWFGGDSFLFFRPVFNVADSSIFTGVASLLLFHRKFFTQDSIVPKEEAAVASEEKEVSA